MVFQKKKKKAPKNFYRKLYPGFEQCNSISLGGRTDRIKAGFAGEQLCQVDCTPTPIT